MLCCFGAPPPELQTTTSSQATPTPAKPDAPASAPVISSPTRQPDAPTAAPAASPAEPTPAAPAASSTPAAILEPRIEEQIAAVAAPPPPEPPKLSPLPPPAPAPLPIIVQPANIATGSFSFGAPIVAPRETPQHATGMRQRDPSTIKLEMPVTPPHGPPNLAGLAQSIVKASDNSGSSPTGSGVGSSNMAALLARTPPNPANMAPSTAPLRPMPSAESISPTSGALPGRARPRSTIALRTPDPADISDIHAQTMKTTSFTIGKNPIQSIGVLRNTTIIDLVKSQPIRSSSPSLKSLGLNNLRSNSTNNPSSGNASSQGILNAA